MSMKTPFARSVGVLIIGATIALTHTAPAQAFFWLLDPNVKEYVDHIHKCKVLGFTDPAKHVRECKPKFVKFVTTQKDDDMSPPPPPPPPPVVIPSPPPSMDEYCHWKKDA